MILETLSPLGEPLGNPKNITGLDWSDLNINESNHLGCVRCTIAVGFNEISPTLSQQLHINLPSKPGRVVVANGRHLIWLSPRSWLILFSLNKVELDNSCLNEYSLNESSLNESSLDKEKKLLESINAAFPDRSVLASAYSDYLCWFSLNGDKAKTVLHQGGFISLAPEGIPVGHAKRTLIAGIPAVIYRTSITEWNLGIERSHASYLQTWFRSLRV
jgi:sarcosine oxidase gamma subunit|tara:strand:- start:85 stop:735 length:651 start_codon:yes stop_codon:yes gene_type:complete